mgnify:CR=1 FL=1
MKQRMVFALRVLGCVLCGAGMVFFLLPLLRHGFALGSVFGECVCLLGLLLLLGLADDRKEEKQGG